MTMAFVPIAIPRLLTDPVMLARVDLANLDPPVTEASSKAGVASAGEPVDAIDTAAVLANIVGAIVPVDLTAGAREAIRTLAGVRVNGIMADPVVVAGIGGAVVDVHLARLPGEPCKFVGCQGEISWLSGWKLNQVSV